MFLLACHTLECNLKSANRIQELYLVSKLAFSWSTVFTIVFQFPVSLSHGIAVQ